MNIRTSRRRLSAVLAATALAGAATFTGQVAAQPVEEAATDVAERVILAPAADAARGMTITFRAAEQGAAVEYRAAGAAEVTRVDTMPKAGALTGAHQSAELTDLAPATEYEYRIVVGGDSGEAGPWRSFTTAPDGFAGPTDMIFFGDAQNGLDDEWRTSASAALAGVPDAELILQSGDMIDQAHVDSEWGSWYDSLSGAPATTPLLTAIGNHEFLVDPLASAHTNHFTHPANGPELLRNSTYYVDRGGVRIITLTANSLLLDQQAAFLEEALASNPNEWSMVMFHQPIHNGTTNRNDTTYGDAFTEIIERNDVDLVLNGHDHTYARGHKTSNVVDGVNTGPVYLVATAGSKYYPTAPENPSWSEQGAERAVWAQDTSTYQRITVDACTLDVTAVVTVQGEDPVTSNEVAGAGSVLDEFTIDKCGDSKQVR
ncbi:metallophosphoesterase family protein [uncultured Corynebacterium sp.]|uniref:purple acid phosphatase family protein n=1 Tax=uncultured Corynebacterium sp. TaxID=159447 RepID=UPI0025E5C02E|nr:metallophosphoesterase family protein [uncultured Corynebacterium sp.]